MIDLYSIAAGASPNVYKVIIALEEMGQAYRLKNVDIFSGEQFRPEFLAISPNARVPAIVDNDPTYGTEPIAVFESGAILTYLADKTGSFLAPTSQPRERSEALQWVFWQMAAVGPILGQYVHFKVYAPEPQPYSLTRYRNELNRLCEVLNARLADRPYVAGPDYGIADMVLYPPFDGVINLGPEITGKIPNVLRWHGSIAQRPAVERAYNVKGAVAGTVTMQSDPKAWNILFGQTAKTMRGEDTGA